MRKRCCVIYPEKKCLTGGNRNIPLIIIDNFITSLWTGLKTGRSEVRFSCR